MTPASTGILIALPGLHAEQRGAETAMEAVAQGLARLPGVDVTVVGSGPTKPDRPYRYLQAPCVHRSRFEHWPTGPFVRNDTSWEELTFCWSMLRVVDAADFDVRITCSYPFVNLLTRLQGRLGRGLDIFVTQNGDWPCHRRNSEFRLFRTDGLVCTNPDYFDAHRSTYPCALIPNGVDPDRFHPGQADRREFGLPVGVPLVLMVSALIPSKRVLQGIRAVSAAPNLHLAIAGDGPLRDEADALGRQLLGDRYRRFTLPRDRMPALYRCADVMLHMSKDEPSANAYIEALATGLPIVTEDRRVTRWTLEDTAYLVSTDRPDAVQDALLRAVGEQRADQRHRRRELVDRRFRWQRIAHDYLAFINSLRCPS